MRKKAEMGIGTLIIFIAMILVAAIAAGVLIQTATSLQNKALLTGERSKSQVSTSVRPMLVSAEDGSTGHSVDTFYIKAKLAPGSDSVRLSDMLVELSLKNASDDMVYNSSVYGNSTVNYTFCDYMNETNITVYNSYFIDYLIEGANHAEGYLQRGDVIKLCFKSSRAVGEDETISIMIVPKIGSPTQIETAMPDIITEQRITLFP